MLEIKDKEAVLNDIAVIFEQLKEENPNETTDELLNMALILYSFSYVNKDELTLDEIIFTVEHLVDVIKENWPEDKEISC